MGIPLSRAGRVSLRRVFLDRGAARLFRPSSTLPHPRLLLAFGHACPLSRNDSRLSPEERTKPALRATSATAALPAPRLRWSRQSPSAVRSTNADTNTTASSRSARHGQKRPAAVAPAKKNPRRLLVPAACGLGARPISPPTARGCLRRGRSRTGPPATPPAQATAAAERSITGDGPRATSAAPRASWPWP